APLPFHVFPQHAGRAGPGPDEKAGGEALSALWQASKAAMPKGPSHKEEALIPPARRPGFWRSGDPLVWMSAGALAVSLLMVLGLVLLVALRGAAYLWPAP